MISNFLETLYLQVSSDLISWHLIRWKLISNKQIEEKYWKDFLNSLFEKYLLEDINEIMFLYLKKLDWRPVCKKCWKVLIWKDRGWKWGRSYGEYCNRECMWKDIEKTKRDVTKNLERQNNCNYQDVLNHLKKFNLENLTLSEQFYLYRNKISSIPTCKECWQKCNYHCSESGYWEFCSTSCSGSNKRQVETKHLTRHKINKEEFDKYCSSFNFTKQSLGAKLYLFLNKLESIPTCKNCWKETKYFSQKEGFQNYCSKSCYLTTMPKFLLDSNLKDYYKKHIELISDIVDLSQGDCNFETYKERGSGGRYQFVCKTCGHSFEDYLVYNWLPRCMKCLPPNTSFEEKKILDFLESLWVSLQDIILRDKTVLNWKELDIYLPKYNLAIEYNWLLWHSFWNWTTDKFNNANLEETKKNYHLSKTEECEKLWIQLFHINENEWLLSTKQTIWKSIVSSALGKNVRLTRDSLEIQVVSYQDSCVFLNQNDLKWEDLSINSTRLWLYQLLENWEKELVFLMTFWKSKDLESRNIWTLQRICSKKYTIVDWGEWRLFDYFKENYMKPWESIFYYADRRYENWKNIETLDFKLNGTISPDYFYFSDWRVEEVFSWVEFLKHKLKDKLTIFDETLTESENMYNSWFRKFYDSWKLVYLFS